MIFRRLYDRLGPRYLRLFSVFALAVTLPMALLLVGLGAPYFDASAAELAGLLAVDWGGFLLAAVLATRRWAPMGRALESWMAGGRDPQTAAGLWDETVRLPYRMPMRAFVDGMVFVGAAGSVYLAVVVDLEPIESAIALAALIATGFYIALLLYFGLELYLRPVLRDLAASMAVEPQLERPRTPFARKLFAALLLVGESTGLSMAWVLSLSEASLETLAVAFGVAFAVTLTSTLGFTVLFTASLYAPFVDLLDATRRVGEGDLSARVPAISDDDLALLARSFNEMAGELARSREELVTAREEERRRLRRDLHDELGPTLASVAMRIEAAGGLVDSDPAAARAMLAELRGEVGDAVAHIRRVVYALRPPQLDELGLVGAIEERAAQLVDGDGRGVTVRVEAPDRLEALPAAVEVAAFRIAQEALVNAARHAEAASCTVTVRAGGALELEVRDDGAGLTGRPGVGIASMRERAAELGGTCTVEPGPGGGTVVRARLPLS